MPHRRYSADCTSDWTTGLYAKDSSRLQPTHYKSYGSEADFCFDGLPMLNYAPLYDSTTSMTPDELEASNNEILLRTKSLRSTDQDIIAKGKSADLPWSMFNEALESENMPSKHRDSASDPFEACHLNGEGTHQDTETSSKRKRLTNIQHEPLSSSISNGFYETEAESNAIQCPSSDSPEHRSGKLVTTAAHAQVEQRYRAGIKARFDDLLNILIQSSGNHKLSAASRKVDILDHAIQYIEQAEKEKRFIVRENDLKAQIKVLENGAGLDLTVLLGAHTVKSAML